MKILSRPYSEFGVVDADVFASFTEHSHSSRLLLLNGVKVSGVWYIDSMGSLRSGYGPSVMLDDVGQPFGLLLSASDTECVGVILSQAAFNWIPVLAPHRNKPSWAVLASSSTVEPVLLTEARIDPLPTVSTNLSLFLVPIIFPFTFKLPSLYNLRLEDLSKLATARGDNVAEWAQIMLNYITRTRRECYYPIQLPRGQRPTRAPAPWRQGRRPFSPHQQAWTMSFSGVMYV